MARKSVTVKIKGIKWRFRVLTDRVFNRNHSEGNFRAVTLPEKRMVDFRASDFIKPVIYHELCHCFYTSCLNCDADHNPDQVEETLAKVWEMHYNDVGIIANLIYDTLKGD